jgi:hypothetical protein
VSRDWSLFPVSGGDDVVILTTWCREGRIKETASSKEEGLLIMYKYK